MQDLAKDESVASPAPQGVIEEPIVPAGKSMDKEASLPPAKSTAKIITSISDFFATNPGNPK